MSKQDDQFLPELVDDQIESLAHQENSDLPEAHLVSDLRQIYEEEREVGERVWTRLNSHVMQNIRERRGQKDQAPHMSVKEARSMRTKENRQPSEKKRWYPLQTVAAVLISVVLVGSGLLLFQSRQIQGFFSPSKETPTAQNQTVDGSPGPSTPTVTPQPPTSVMLSLSAPGIAPTTQGAITVPAGTKVTLTVIPDHSLLPFQIFTMGIYATDPEPFSQLQHCSYPDTDTCTYTISSTDIADYTSGKHTFVAYLGNIGGAILEHSNSITITWS